MEYVKLLFDFSVVFYRETTILERVKKEELAAILTPSDEAFLLLLLIVYYEDKTDTEYSAIYEGKQFVLRSGWQEAGIDLFNRLYREVIKDREENGVLFEESFCLFYAEYIDGNNNKKKHKPKVPLPAALNDL